MKTALLGAGRIPVPVQASGVGIVDTGGYYGGGPLTLEEVLALIGAGLAPGAFLTVIGGGKGTVQALGTLGATETIDLANGNKFWGTLDQACTISTTGWTNLKDCQISVELIENGTGGWTPTFSGVTWIDGTPTWDTTAGTVTHVVLFSRDGGTTIYGAVVGAGSSGSGGRPPYDYVVAANDTATDLKAIADAVCDATADEVQINVAIAAAVTANRPYSILLLPGTYEIAAGIDFRGLTAMSGKWVTFEASDTKIVADANMTTMIRLDPSAGGQILACLDLRLGAVIGSLSTRTVTQLINMCRFSDNRVRINDLNDVSGIAFNAATSGVADYPTANNDIDIGTIRSNTGTAFNVTSGTNQYGFTGNRVTVGQVIFNANGFVIGDATNDNATYNVFVAGPIEHNTGSGIEDLCGGNTWIVNNLNTNGAELAGPTGMNLRSTYIVHIDMGSSGTIDADVLAQHYVQINGASYGRNLIAEQSAPATPPSGFGDIYWKTDGILYGKNDAGTEYDLTGGGTFATPAIVLGTAAAAGAATTVIRSDSTIVAFDATAPANVTATAATGAAAVAARRDHVHALADTAGHWELLMAAGITSPPEPLENGAGDDWLYVWVP